MALGPVILGHAHDAVNRAIIDQLEHGITFTLPHPIEIDVAEAVVAAVPGADRVRFAKSGSDATSAAVRLARAVTGRDRVIACGYHGWHDWYVGTTSRHQGVPSATRALTTTFRYNDLASLDAALQLAEDDVAAVVLEPSGAMRPIPGFLQGVLDRAHGAGALVVFDEIITGFRLGRGGAQERYGVTADLVALGKGLANGMPLSALAGRAELMNQLEGLFFSGTHGGETLSLAAARATLAELTPGVYADLRKKGERLRAGIEAAISAHGLTDWIVIDGEPERTVVQIREPDSGSEMLVAKSLVQQELAKLGVLFNGSNFICAAHSNADLDQAIDAYGAAFRRLADALPDRVAAAVEGPPVQPAFRPL
jgi:glutamate-1-semialdehyde aminotransferase